MMRRLVENIARGASSGRGQIIRRRAPPRFARALAARAFLARRVRSASSLRPLRSALIVAR
jgi:hypothetical protein